MPSLRVALFTLLALIHVSVANEPTLQIMPENIMKDLGDGVYAECEALVDDVELVTDMKWIGPGEDAIPNEGETIMEMDTGEEHGKLGLMIQNLREKDAGIYTCTAVYAGNQNLATSIEVKAFRAIDFGDIPLKQTPLLHSKSKIKCNPTGVPMPKVDWLKNSKSISNDENHIIEQDGLLINNVTEEDEGVYKCRARVKELGSMNVKEIQVVVYIEPKINIVPEDAKGVEQESVTFNCGAIGKPQPSYSWVNKDNEVLDEKEGYYVDKDTGVLTVLDLKPEHTGAYRCTAKNDVGEDTATANLQVLTKPKMEKYDNITVTVETDAEFRCIFSGNPLPQIVFKKEVNEHDFIHGINEDDRIEIIEEESEEGYRVGIMKIRGVLRKDDGLYTCTASSEGGLTVVWGHITVEFPPTFEEQQLDEVWSFEQEPVNLTCLATSIPNATVSWYFRNEQIDAQDPNMKVMALGPLGVLEVHPSQAYYGTYTCDATNVHGSATYDLQLKEASVPGPVANVQLHKKTATTVEWEVQEPMDNGGLEIEGFIVQYRLQDQSWDEAIEKFFTKKSSAEYIMDELSPQSTYVFRFLAENKAGRGEWGGEKVEEMPKRAEPEEPLIYNNALPAVNDIPYKTHYELQWQVPHDNGEPIDYFDIMYYKVKNSTQGWAADGDKFKEQTKQSGGTSFTVKNLKPDTYYKIELRAHNIIGFSTPAETIIKTAFDPSAEAGTGGSSKPLNSAPTSITTPAHGPDEPEAAAQGMGTGLLVGIIIIIALVSLVVLDVACYCTKNAGLTATLVGKRGPQDKDKEAMLEEGKNASADTLNEESKDEKKLLDEKPLPEKEVPNDDDLEKKVDIISEKEIEDKHEGNGDMKPAKEEEDKPVVQPEADDKIKETTEPTETTPMIQQEGEKDDKEAILKEEEQNEEALKKSESKGSVTKDSPV